MAYKDSELAPYVRRAKNGERVAHLSRESGISISTLRKAAEKSKDSLIKEYIANPVRATYKENVVLVIPDMHHPFCHQDSLEFLKAVKKRFNPNLFVCLGDEIDAHAFSRFPKDPDGLSAGQELQAAIDALVPFYVEFPNMLVCESNHTVRPMKQMFEAGLPKAFHPSYATMLNAPDGWVWKERHLIDDTIYIHGDQGRCGKRGWAGNTETFHKSVVVGHMHSRAGVVYDNHLFNMNTGCLIDEHAYVFKYASKVQTRANLGCGLVIGGKAAHFLPMLLDNNGRWTGRL